jgi:hypothetical protein
MMHRSTLAQCASTASEAISSRKFSQVHFEILGGKEIGKDCVSRKGAKAAKFEEERISLASWRDKIS